MYLTNSNKQFEVASLRMNDTEREKFLVSREGEVKMGRDKLSSDLK